MYKFLWTTAGRNSLAVNSSFCFTCFPSFLVSNSCVFMLMCRNVFPAWHFLCLVASGNFQLHILMTGILKPVSGIFPSGWSGWGLKSTTGLHLVLEYRMNGAVPQLSYMPSWHAQHQLYCYFFIIQEQVILNVIGASSWVVLRSDISLCLNTINK